MANEIIIPAAGESVTEADIVQWHKADGDYVEMDEALVELETDKASMDLAAEASGILSITVDSGTVQVGQVVGTIAQGDAPAKPAATATEAPASKAAEAAPVAESAPQANDNAANHYAAGHPSPAAKNILDEKGLSAADVKGSGKDGRITKEDASKASAKPSETKAPAASSAVQVEPGKRQTRREPLSRLRKTLMNRLVESQQVTASLSTFNEIDMSAVMNFRKEYKEAFKEKYGIGLGFMSFFAKAATMALQNMPQVNAMIDGTDMVYNDFYDIGIAVSTPKGLIVPVIRNTDQLGFHEVESAIRDFALRGRDGKVTIDEMSGGTFTITNGGTFGSMLSTPILNRPQSAILGMHNIVQRPVAVNGSVEIRPIMYVALTYDHRIIDGAEAVRFLVNIKELIEDPRRLLIGI